ncbi:MAG: DNA polymerase III subunit gamma/tau [Candidatus Krumholzibacteriaceae bacterium]|jgi:DNA polymerase-3 subunit gamma/tau
MSYLVLARKWRPQTFSEVVGQEHITETLKKAVEKGRIAHAYLFAGPRGCGKTTTARLLAKIINCENPKGAEPCNECASCRAITEGRHLDVIEIDGASNRGIDEIRDLREKISYAPAQGRSKIYIIDEVHMLTPQAFNALLKTLEEPPVHVYLIFATTEPHKVPTTILSRCQRFNFKRLELREISAQLEKICTAEKVKHESEALTLLARRAEGSMRDGESLLDQCIAASEGTVDLALVRRVLGLVDSQLVTDLLKAIGARDRGAALAIVDRVVEAGLDLEEFFLAYIEGLRNLLVLSVEGGASPGFLDLSKGEIAELSAIGKAFKTENLLYLFRAAVRSYRELKASGQPRYQLEAALAEAASWESAVELSELIRHLDSMGGPGSSKASAPERKAEAPARERKPDGGKPRAATVDRDRGPVHPESAPEEAPEMLPDADAPGPEAPLEVSGAFARVDPAGRVDPTGIAPARTAEEDAVLLELGGKEAWERFLSQVRETKLTLGIWLVSARVASVAGQRLCLSFSPQNRFAREMVLEEKNRRFIEYHLERFFGRKLFIEADEQCEGAAQGGKPARSEAPRKRAEAPPELQAVAGDAPVIKRLIEDFDGELFKEKS